jgi:hypothetical protein
MRKILLLIAVSALLPAPSAAAEQLRQQKSDKSISARQLPLKGARTDQSCAAYGAGFVRVDGTQTCVKIGGAVSIGVGGSR